VPKPSRGEGEDEGMMFSLTQLPSSSARRARGGEKRSSLGFSPGLPDGRINLVFFGPIPK
jgi:hypothetical protein